MRTGQGKHTHEIYQVISVVSRLLTGDRSDLPVGDPTLLSQGSEFDQLQIATYFASHSEQSQIVVPDHVFDQLSDSQTHLLSGQRTTR